ncbi:MAG: hypothetical protein AMXMBFR13_30400 [Phycisphaerae bacterium]
MFPPSGKRVLGGRLHMWIGAALLCHFAGLCTIKLAFGITHEIWWMSHLALLLGGAGLLLRSVPVVATALTAILMPHIIWLVDCVGWLASGEFPLGMTCYLANANIWTWIGTMHHFYLGPLLAWAVLRHGQYPARALANAVIIYLYLVIGCRALLSPAANVNFSYGLPGQFDWPAVHWVNRLPGAVYLLVVTAFMSLAMFLPTALTLRWCCRKAGPSRPEVTA